MYPSTPLNSEWLSTNAARAYPLADNATEIDTTGSFRLPRNLIVDFTMSMDLSTGALTGADILPGGFHVSNVSVFAHGVVITVSHTNVTTVPVFTIPLSVASHVPFTSYTFYGQGQFARTVGKIMIGTLEDTLAYGGSFNLNVEGGRILPTLIRPSIGGIGGVYVVNGITTSPLLTGDIYLVAGKNINLRTTLNAPGSPIASSITIDCVRTEGLVDCTGEQTPGLPPPIRTINGIPPRDNDGGFEIIPGEDGCVSISSGTTVGAENSLLLSNPCSKPCCASPELKEIENDVNNLNTDVRGMRNFMSRLENYLQSLDDIKIAVQTSGLLGDSDYRG